MPEFSITELNDAINQDDVHFPLVNSELLTRDFHLADYQHEIIMNEIAEFESLLDDDHEVAIKLASFGKSITMAVTDIGYCNPEILVFCGYVGNDYATLIQHVSQLNFLLLSVPKQNPDEPPRRIGFQSSNED